MPLPFEDRREAGRVLADSLLSFSGQPGLIVLALPRGGVPVGYEVALALGVPLDVFVVRKLGVPGEEELAMGAVASGGARVLNEDVIKAFNISDAELADAVAREEAEIQRRERLYHPGREPLDVAGSAVILVDDGLATGATMRVAIAALRKLGASQVVAAAPVGAASTAQQIAAEADGIVCPFRPKSFRALGEWYLDFRQTSDEEVRRLLDLTAARF